MAENLIREISSDFKKELKGPPPKIILKEDMSFFLNAPDKIEDSSSNPEYHVPKNIKIKCFLLDGKPNKEENYAVATIMKIGRKELNGDEFKKIENFTIDFKKDLKIKNVDKIYIEFGEIRSQLEKNKKKSDWRVRQRVGKVGKVNVERKEKSFKEMGRRWSKTGRYHPPYPEED